VNVDLNGFVPTLRTDDDFLNNLPGGLVGCEARLDVSASSASIAL
jgi:hypothetical protein